MSNFFLPKKRTAVTITVNSTIPTETTADLQSIADNCSAEEIALLRKVVANPTAKTQAITAINQYMQFLT